MDAQTSLPNGNARPDVIDELLLRDDLTRAVGKINQNIKRPIPEGNHLAVAPEQSLANRKFERVKTQLPMTYAQICQPSDDFPLVERYQRFRYSQQVSRLVLK
jgi:hypothetical protein